jgi:rRNA processing protein Gar1
MDKIGNVYDIIGPTKSPFVLIKPKKVLKEIFEDLFVVSIHARSGEGKRNRKERSGKRDRKGNRKRRNP